MDLHIVEPRNCQVVGTERLKEFLQRVANRFVVGGLRYGSPRKEKKYLSRLKEELKCYKKTGNNEHLLNVAVYCCLESIAPENKQFHFDPTVDSVTREKFGA